MVPVTGVGVEQIYPIDTNRSFYRDASTGGRAAGQYQVTVKFFGAAVWSTGLKAMVLVAG
jgi:hypothetical protein